MSLGISIGLSLRAQYLSGAFDPATLFASGEEGAWYEPSTSTCFTDALGAVAATYGDEVQYLEDLSGNGNHATQDTFAARPILARVPEGGRRNLLEYTEEFDNAYWTKLRATATADTLTQESGQTDSGLVQRLISWSTPHTFEIDVKANGKNWVIIQTDDGTRRRSWFDISSGALGTISGSHTASIDAQGDGWYRCSITASSSDRITVYLADADNSVTVVDSGGVRLRKAQLEEGSTATAYQKVVSEYDVTEDGVTSLDYLSFDGTDDGMATASIDFTGTDEMSVFAGVTREAASGSNAMLLELSDSFTSNTGVFAVISPSTSGTLDVSTIARGDAAVSGGQSADGPTITSTPQTNVFSGLHDISGDSSILRIDGTQVDEATGDKGAGNFGDYPLYIGARGGTSLFYEGNFYGLIVRGVTSTSQETSDTESYLAGRVGFTAPTITGVPTIGVS